MPLVRDIKNRDSKKTLVIKLEDNFKSTKKTVDKKPKKEKKSEYVFFMKKEESSHLVAKNKEFFRMLIAGFFIVFVFNLAQIGTQFLSIASEVEANAFQGFERFVSGGKDAIDANFGGAVQYFDSANFAFKNAQEKVWFIGNQGVTGSKGSIAESAYGLMEAGAHLSSGASYFSQGVSALQEIPVLFMENNMNGESKSSEYSLSLTEKLKSSLELVEMALDEVKAAQNEIKNAGPALLPDNLKSHFGNLTAQLDNLISNLESMKMRVPAMLSLLGDRYPHRYLVLLQNNSESRPTGGFIGSFLIVDVNDGYITNVEFHDVYEYDGQLNDYIEAPLEIAALTDNWRMRDANYSPDFAISAKKVAWFLERQGGPGVDTVIAVNQSILKDLLTITGPLPVEGLDANINANNYQTILTYIVESKLEGREDPKGVIGRVVPAVQVALTKDVQAKSLITLIQNQIRDKDVLAWSKNDNIQQFFDDVGISGRVKITAEKEDYFNLITINVGGNKSDSYINSSVAHETIIGKNGEVRDIVTYKRTHTWEPNIVSKWKSQLEPFGYGEIEEWLQNILGKGENKSVIKIFVPKGTELEDIIGVPKEEVKIGYDEELDKTYMYFTLSVPPQQEAIITMTYKLPYKLDLRIADQYKLTVQKQPGTLNDVKFVKRILADQRITNYRNYPEEVVYTQGKALEYETSLMTDLYFASLWGID